jgi:hypothetical protein
VFELLKGGGAVAGLTFAAGELKEMAEAASKLREEFQAGTISAGQMVDRLVQAIPVIGTFRQAGLAIREFFTGDEAALRAAKERAAQIDSIADAQKKLIEQQRDLNKENEFALQQLRAQADLIGATPFQKAAGAVGIQTAAQSHATAAQLAKVIEERKAESAALLAKLHADTEAKRAAIPSPFEPSFSERRDKFGTVAENKAKRDAEIKTAQDALKAANDAEVRERDRANKEIAELERNKFETLTTIGGIGFAQVQELFQQEQERLRKEQQEAQQKAFDVHVRQAREEMEKVLDLRREAAIEAGRQFGNLDDADADLFDPQGGAFLQAAIRRNRERLEGRGPSSPTGSLFAESLASRFVAGSVADPASQLANEMRQQRQETRDNTAELKKVVRGLIDFTGEIRQRGTVKPF